MLVFFFDPNVGIINLPETWLTIICINAKNINKNPSELSRRFNSFANQGKKAIMLPQTNKGIKIEIHADIKALI